MFLLTSSAGLSTSHGNCVITSNCGAKFEVEKTSINLAKPSFNHNEVHHSWNIQRGQQCFCDDTIMITTWLLDTSGIINYHCDKVTKPLVSHLMSDHYCSSQFRECSCVGRISQNDRFSNSIRNKMVKITISNSVPKKNNQLGQLYVR